MAQQATPIPDLTADYARGRLAKPYRGVRNLAQGTADFLPQLASILGKSTGGTANDAIKSNLDLLLNYGPQFSAATTAASRAGQIGAANTDLDLLSGVGGDITGKTLDLQKLADPEFFGMRSLIGSKAQDLLASQDPTKLTDAELAAAERGANRSNVGKGVAGSGSPTAAIANAGVFGNKLNEKRQNLLSSLTNIGNFAPNLKSGAFNYANATGQAGAGAGQGMFANTFNTSQQQAGNLASNLMGQAGALQAQRVDVNANKTQPWERVVGALPDY